MKHNAGLFLFRVFVLLLVVCLSVPAALAEGDTYIFCVRDDEGRIVAAMDQEYTLQSNLNWLNFQDNPPEQAYAQAIAAMKRDRLLSTVGKLSFIPPEYIPEYTGGKQGVFVQMGVGFPIFVMSGDIQAVILIDEFSKDEKDIGLALVELYAWLGSAAILKDNLGAPVQIYQIQSAQDEGYVFDLNECFAYEAIYAYLGNDSVWAGSTGMEADSDAYARWFLAQATIRRMTVWEDPDFDVSAFLSYIPDESGILVVTDTEAEMNYVIVKTPEETFVMAIMGGFAADPMTEEMIIEGYVHGIFRQSGYQPDDYRIQSLIVSDGSLILSASGSDTGAGRADQLINAWIQFAMDNAERALQVSGQ